jgi:hypothetical protein
MIRLIVSSFAIGLVVLSSCATAQDSGVGVTHTTAGLVNNECLLDSTDCLRNTDCCSTWCVNGECGQILP